MKNTAAALHQNSALWQNGPMEESGQAEQGFSKRSSPESCVSALLGWFLWPYSEGCVPAKSGQHRRTLKRENHLNAEQK